MAAGAVDLLIETAGFAAHRGDYVAGIEAPRRRLQPSNDPAFVPSGAGGIGEFRDAPHPVRSGFGPSHLYAAGAFAGQGTQRAVARQGKDVLYSTPFPSPPAMASGRP